MNQAYKGYLGNISLGPKDNFTNLELQNAILHNISRSGINPAECVYHVTRYREPIKNDVTEYYKKLERGGKINPWMQMGISLEKFLNLEYRVKNAGKIEGLGGGIYFPEKIFPDSAPPGKNSSWVKNYPRDKLSNPHIFNKCFIYGNQLEEAFTKLKGKSNFLVDIYDKEMAKNITLHNSRMDLSDSSLFRGTIRGSMNVSDFRKDFWENYEEYYLSLGNDTNGKLDRKIKLRINTTQENRGMVIGYSLGEEPAAILGTYQNGDLAICSIQCDRTYKEWNYEKLKMETKYNWPRVMVSEIGSNLKSQSGHVVRTYGGSMYNRKMDGIFGMKSLFAILTDIKSKKSEQGKFDSLQTLSHNQILQRLPEISDTDMIKEQRRHSPYFLEKVSEQLDLLEMSTRTDGVKLEYLMRARKEVLEEDPERYKEIRFNKYVPNNNVFQRKNQLAMEL
jgi:hypothetical protein